MPADWLQTARTIEFDQSFKGLSSSAVPSIDVSKRVTRDILTY